VAPRWCTERVTYLGEPCGRGLWTLFQAALLRDHGGAALCALCLYRAAEPEKAPAVHMGATNAETSAGEGFMWFPWVCRMLMSDGFVSGATFVWLGSSRQWF